MKELDNVFKEGKGKKSSILDRKIKTNTEVTVPRKIFNNDYETIRLFAFENRMTMLETTEYLYQLIKDGNYNLNDLNEEKYINNSDKEKSLRISNKLSKLLRNISDEQGIPSKYIFSHLVYEFLEKKGGDS